MHIGAFFRDLRGSLGGKPLPYAWVPELHGDGVHFHVHFAVGRYIARHHIESAWGRGIFDIRLIGDLPVGSGALAESRKAAAYLSKYVAKTFTDEDEGRLLRPKGMHRFDVAQGFTPEALRLTGRTVDAVVGEASELMGGWPALHWSSDQVPDWQGPPAVWVQWAG